MNRWHEFLGRAAGMLRSFGFYLEAFFWRTPEEIIG
jgi:hypothetical protein